MLGANEHEASSNSTSSPAPPNELLEIERALASRLQGHRDYLTSITAADSASLSDHLQEQSRRRPTHNESSETATNSAVAPASASESPLTAASLPPSHVHAPMGHAAPQPVNLDGQNAEEQQLEPDVCRAYRGLGQRLRV